MVSWVSRVVKHKQKFWMIFASVFAIAWTSYWFKKHCSMPRGYQSDFQTVKLLLLCFCFLQSWNESANIQNKLFRASSISWIIWTKEVLLLHFLRTCNDGNNGKLHWHLDQQLQEPKRLKLGLWLKCFVLCQKALTWSKTLLVRFQFFLNVTSLLW